MSNYYNILADRILEKYKVEEPTKKPLNEAWAASTPDWLKDVFKQSYRTGYGSMDLAKEKMYRSKKYKKAFDKYKSAGYSDAAARLRATSEFIGNNPQISNIDYKNSSDPAVGDSVYNITRRLNELGIDLTSNDLKFIEDTPPTSKNDERLQSPNLAFFYFKSDNDLYMDQIYVPGVNENEKFGIYEQPFISLKMVGRAFHNISFKKISQNCTAFAYVDISNIKRVDFNKKYRDRYNNAWDFTKSVVQGKERFPSKINKDSRIYKYSNRELDPSYGDYDYDKSGYVKIPPAQRYADILEKNKLKKYATKLTNLENALKKTQDKFRDIMSNASLEDLGGGNLSYDSGLFFSNFYKAYHYYQDCLNIIDKAGVPGTDEFYEYLDREDFSTTIEKSEKFVSVAEKALKNFAYAELDF